MRVCACACVRVCVCSENRNTTSHQPPNTTKEFCHVVQRFLQPYINIFSVNIQTPILVCYFTHQKCIKIFFHSNGIFIHVVLNVESGPDSICIHFLSIVRCSAVSIQKPSDPGHPHHYYIIKVTKVKSHIAVKVTEVNPPPSPRKGVSLWWG